MRQLSEKFSMSKLDIVDPKVSRGLSKQVAAERLESDGRNALSPPKVISNWKLFLRQFKLVFKGK